MKSVAVVFACLVVICNGQAPLTGKTSSTSTQTGKSYGSSDCQTAVTMVSSFLQTSKVELIKHITAANQQICQLQGWKRVDRSMIMHHHHAGCKHQMIDEKDGGLKVNVQVTEKSCGKTASQVSEFAIHIRGNWQQIMFTQVFEGNASCWAIFGNHHAMYHAIAHELSGGGLEVFSRSHGDVIVSMKNMNSLGDDNFDGRAIRCDNKADNFWHETNGNDERHATVIMRRKQGAKMAGLYTGVYCGTPKYTFKDIYVLM